MSKKIFRAVCFTSLTVLLASIIFIMGVLYEYFSNVRKNELKSEFSLAVNAVRTEGISYLKRLKALETVDYRLTWIGNSGEVLFDSKNDYRDMENHIGREEVQEALETGKGESERYSSTLTEKTIYYAERLDDNSILRISVSQVTVPTLLLGIIQPIAIVFAMAMIISFVLSSKIAERIVEPLNSLDLDNPLENNDVYDEISPLLKRIAKQQRQIQSQKNELNQRKTEFSAITSNMNEGLILLGKDKRIINLNPSAESFLNVQEDCIGKYFIEADRTPDIIHSVEKAETDNISEIQINRGGRTFQLNISCIRDTGEISGFVILIFDITDKIESESRRREFTANVSHELKTPLQSIMGSAELIETGLVKSEDIPKFMENIRSEASRLVTLINDIIKLSQIDEGTDMPKQSFDLYTLAEENILLLENSAEKKSVKITLEGKSVILNSVKSLVSQIIYNLVENAVKYNVVNGSVKVTVSDDENGIYISVADTGIGIPPEHQERIFERFYRVDKSRSKETGGTGLGLSIVKHAVKDTGADLKLESVPGKGTVITVRF